MLTGPHWHSISYSSTRSYVFVNYETTETWRLRENATHAIDIVYEGVKEHLKYIEVSLRAGMLSGSSISIIPIVNREEQHVEDIQF